jgi:hypothetical protein
MNDSDDHDDDEFDAEETDDSDDDRFVQKLHWGPNKRPAIRLNYRLTDDSFPVFSKLFMHLRRSSLTPMPPLGPGAKAGYAHIRFPGERDEIIDMEFSAMGITVAFDSEEYRDDTFDFLKDIPGTIFGPQYE